MWCEMLVLTELDSNYSIFSLKKSYAHVYGEIFQFVHLIEIAEIQTTFFKQKKCQCSMTWTDT